MTMDQTTLQAELEATRKEAGAPGVAAIVVSHNAICQHQAAGVRQLGGTDSLESTDKFHIGSNAKAMTATLVAELVAAKTLAWDSRPVVLFPELAETIHADYAAITLEQILRHRAGLPPFTEMEHFAAAPEFSGSPTEQRLAFTKWVLAQPPHLTPDTAMSYSNAGYGVVAALLEAKSGRSWEALLQTHLFTPLDMEAGFGWPGNDGTAQPWGHSADDENAPLQPHDPIKTTYVLPAIIAPAGDVHLSMPDYGKFLQMNLKVLQDRPTPLANEQVLYLHQDRDGVGLGWGVQKLADQKMSVHSGGGGTFIIVGFVHHDKDLAIAVVANAGTDRAEAAVVAQLKSLLQAYS